MNYYLKTKVYNNILWYDGSWGHFFIASVLNTKNQTTSSFNKKQIMHLCTQLRNESWNFQQGSFWIFQKNCPVIKINKENLIVTFNFVCISLAFRLAKTCMCDETFIEKKKKWNICTLFLKSFITILLLLESVFKIWRKLIKIYFNWDVNLYNCNHPDPEFRAVYIWIWMENMRVNQI